MNNKAIIYNNNIRHNIREIKNKIGKTDIIGVIKGDAYGHGIINVAKICVDEGINKFCVGSIEEGIALRKIGIDKDILLLLPVSKDNIEKLIEYNITPTVYEIKHLKLINEHKNNLQIEIEIDTGIGRSGCKNEMFYNMIEFIKKNNMNLRAIYTHLYDKNNYSNCIKQLEEFKKYKCDIEGVKYHIGGAYALCYGKEFLLDEIRLGIGLYGLADMTRGGCNLKPALELNSKICDIVKVKEGDRIGYHNNEIIFSKDSKLALLNIGYTHGYPNIGNPKVKVKEKFCNIIGGINMMNCCVDISDVEEVKVGDWVNIYSTNVNDENSILNLSKLNNIKPGIFVYSLNSLYIDRIYKD